MYEFASERPIEWHRYHNVKQGTYIFARWLPLEAEPRVCYTYDLLFFRFSVLTNGELQKTPDDYYYAVTDEFMEDILQGYEYDGLETEIRKRKYWG